MSSGLGIASIPIDLLYVGVMRAMILNCEVVLFPSNIASKPALVKTYKKLINGLKLHHRMLYDKHDITASLLPYISNHQFSIIAKDFSNIRSCT